MGYNGRMDTKTTVMCSLHLESKCFKGRRVNWATAKPSQEPRQSTSSSSETGYDHSYSANSEVVIDAKKFVKIEEQNISN